jgi:transposase InsO family protein
VAADALNKVIPCPLDRVNRQFRAERPSQLWVADFTYVSASYAGMGGLVQSSTPAGTYRQRLLEPIGYIQPTEAEAQYYRQLAKTNSAIVT